VLNNSAVSEVVGYILIFGIVMGAISFIYLVGFPALQNSQDVTQFRGVEQGFLVLQSDIAKVAYDQASVRTTKIGLGSGSLVVNPNKCNLSITINGDLKFNDTIGLIEFTSTRNDKIAWIDGGVFKKYSSGGGSIMVFRPRIFKVTNSINNNTIFLTLIRINNSLSASSIGGSGIASITTSTNLNPSLVFNTPEVYYNGNMTIKITNEYARAWKNYLDDEFDEVGILTNNDETVTYNNIQFDELMIVEYVIDVTAS